MGSYFDYRDNCWVPRSADEVDRLLSFIPQHGDKGPKPELKESMLVIELPGLLNSWPLRIPDFHIPIRSDREAQLRDMLQQVDTCVRTKTKPPRSVAVQFYQCVDSTKSTTSRIGYLISEYIL